MGALLPSQFSELLEAIDSAFPALPAFDLMLTTIGRNRETIVAGIAGLGKPVIVALVLRAAESQGWTLDLVAGARKAAQDNPLLKKFIADYPDFDPTKPPPPAVDHYQTRFLLGGRVFLRREDLRTKAKLIGVEDNSRVLVVTGPRVSGKTYSRDFITYVLAKDPQQRLLTQKVLYFDLDDYPSGPGDLARRIGTQLGLKKETMPESKGEQDSRWVPDLLDWLVGGINAHPADVVWLILDGFRVHSLPGEVHDLLARLVKEADSTTPKLRMVLLNYGQRDLVAPFALNEAIDAEPVKRKHIEEFVEHLYQRSGKTYTPENVTKAVDDILAQVDQQLQNRPDAKDRWLEYVSVALTKAAPVLSA